MTETPTAPATKRRGRTLRAVLAAGLVLGVGTAVTLAAWTDSEFAQRTFTAGTFNLVGSTDGTTYTDHGMVGSPATLGFTVNAAALSPTAVTTAPFAVRLAANTTDAATVTVTSAATTGTVSNLTYELLQTATFGCTAGTTGTTLVPAGTDLSTVSGTTTFPLVQGAAGAPVFLCFKVTAGTELVQGQTGTATWQFQATSQ